MTRRFPILLSLLCAATAHAQLVLPRPSQLATVSQRVGVTDITVRYSRPAVKGRMIWGGLIPNGMVWRTGANESTTIAFTDEVSIQGHKVPRGTYSLHTIPAPDEWTVILNRDYDEWGSFEYDKTKDLLRIQVKPAASEHHELLSFSFPEVTPTSAVLALQWDKVKVAFRVDVDVVPAALTRARGVVCAAAADDWQTPFRAAKYAFENKVAADEALSWVRRSIAAQERFENVSLEAQMLSAAKSENAAARVRRAIELGRAAKADVRELEALVSDGSQ